MFPKVRHAHWVGWLVLLLAGAVPLSAAPRQPLRIVCIGDSLVQGGHFGADDFTFRYPLYLGLKAAGLPVDFLGTRHKGLNPDFVWPPGFDPDHEGFYGARTSEVLAALTQDLPHLASPDWAVILLGENDGTKDVDRAIFAPMETIVELLREKNPNVGIVLIQVPGFWKEMEVHWKMWTLGQQLSTEGSPVLVLPLDITWNPKEDTYDGDHPNPKGQQKIARLVLDALLPRLGPVTKP